LPSGVSVVDDPGAKDFNGTPLIGGYTVDMRCAPSESHSGGERQPEERADVPQARPDSNESNGHGRAAFLNDAKPTMSNLFFSSAETLSAEEMKKKFLDTCRAEKLAYCLVVREMDNPALSLLHQEDFSRTSGKLWRRRGTGDRLPLVVYRIYPETGREEMIRGSRIIGLNSRALRKPRRIGNDSFVYNSCRAR